MKKILMIITSLLFIICSMSCSEDKKLINIEFIYEGNSYKVEVEESSTIDNKIIPIEDNEYMEIYYDEEFLNKYNNEKINNDIILYLKSSIVNFNDINLNEIKYIKIYNNLSETSFIIDEAYYEDVLTLEDYKYVKIEENINSVISFEIKTNDQLIKYYKDNSQYIYKEVNGYLYKSISLVKATDNDKYVSILLEEYEKLTNLRKINIEYILNNNIYTSEILIETDKGIVITDEIIPIEYSQYMEIYYDEELTIKYNGEKIISDEVFYLKSNIVSFEKISLEDIEYIDIYNYSLSNNHYKVDEKNYNDVLVLEKLSYLQVEKQDAAANVNLIIKTKDNKFINYYVVFEKYVYKEIEGQLYKSVEKITRDEWSKLNDILNNKHFNNESWWNE